MNGPVPAEPPGQRLERLLRAKSCIIFHEDLPDREFPHVKCSIYGATKTNELFVKLTNGRVAFVDAVPSPLIHPAMADRVFGMDVDDHAVAFQLAEELWQRHRDELVRR